MPLKYKIDVLSALKEKGYNTNKIRKGAKFDFDIVALFVVKYDCLLFDAHIFYLFIKFLLRAIEGSLRDAYCV